MERRSNEAKWMPEYTRAKRSAVCDDERAKHSEVREDEVARSAGVVIPPYPVRNSTPHMINRRRAVKCAPF